jgi:pimeloyl-ACP methyl ester carboxylesterase
MKFDSGYSKVGPLKMYYEVHGTGAPLVLLHGGGSGLNATFGRILKDLARNHKVIGIEQQGHGHTPDIDRPFSLEQMADDSAVLLNELGIDTADVFGFSNGGQVAMYLAIKHPEKVKKLILASTFYSPAGVIPELRRAWASNPTVEDMPQGLRDEYKRVAPKSANLQTHIDKSQVMMRAFKGIARKDIQHIAKPTLIINGDRDVVLLGHALAMKKLIVGSRLVVLPGAHGAYLGELSTSAVKTNLPKITVELVDEFLNGFTV